MKKEIAHIKNKILSGLITIALCIVLIPVGCFLFLLHIIWSIADKFIRVFV